MSKVAFQEGGVRIGSSVALALLSAALLALAFPPFNLWMLIWVVLVPALVAQYWLMPRQLSALPQAIAVGVWLGVFLGPVFGGQGVMALLPLMIFGITLLAASGERAFNERTGFRWFVLYGAVSWVGIEMIRSFIPVMGTWAFVANTLHSQPWLIQPVSVFSIFGLSLVILLVNYGLALGVLYLLSRRASASLPRISVGIVRAWGVGVLIVVGGWVGLSLLLYREAEAPRVRVAALHYDAGAPWGAPDMFMALSRQAAQAGARVIVWPELAIEGDPQISGTAMFRQLAAETNAYLVLGYMGGRSEPGSFAWRNEATVLAPDGRFLGVFGKDHPVLFAGEGSLTRGTYSAYETSVGRLGTIICHDMDFTDTARNVTRNGAQLILAPSYDWAGIAAVHYTHLVFRAVENRVSAVKSDGSGNDSVVIDPYGRILAAAITPGGDEQGQVVIADVPLGTGDAPAIWLGDWVGWLALVGMVAFGVYDAVGKHRTRLNQRAVAEQLAA